MSDGLGSAGRSRLILVVEDEADVRLSAVEAMLAMGYRTIEAEHAAAAITVLEQHSDIDLLLTDVRMPGEMDGAELAFTVRSRWPAIGIVVISGYFDPKASRLPAGAGFLSKPYRIRELNAAIEQQLDNDRLASRMKPGRA
jgi:two-component system, response regulator PdtaR